MPQEKGDVKCAHPVRIDEAMPIELEYCQTQVVQNAVTNRRKECVDVAQNAIEFDKIVSISLNVSQDWTSLHDSQLEVTCKVTRPGGAACDHAAAANADKVGVANNLFHTMFKRVDLSVNDSIVERCDEHYAWSAYVEELTQHQSFALQKRAPLTAWCKDTAGKLTIAEKGGGNEGMDKRSLPFNTSALVTLTGTLKLDMVRQQCYLPPNCKVRLDLTPSESAFSLMASAADGTAKYELRITAMRLWVERATLLPHVQLALTERFAKLPNNELALMVNHCGTKRIVLDKDVAKHTVNLFANQALPDRFFVAFVPNAAYNRQSYAANPFYFHHYSVKVLQATVGNQHIPFVAYEPDFSKKNGYIREYNALLEELGAHRGNASVDITLDDFAGGYAIFPFRIVPSTSCDQLWGAQQTGSATLYLEFAAALTEPLNLLVFYEMRGQRVVPQVIRESVTIQQHVQQVMNS